MFIKSITPRGFLSFAPDSPPLDLQPLNVFIGPNGAGKSNLIEAVRFLKWSTTRGKPQELMVRDGAAAQDWIWKGRETGVASVEVVLADPKARVSLRYRLVVRDQRGRVEVADERLEQATATRKGKKPYFYIGHEKAGVYVNRVHGEKRALTKEQIDPEASILSVYNAPADYPENAWACEALRSVAFYTDPLFGRSSQIRMAQSTSFPRSMLAEDGSNLALILNRVLQSPGMRARFTELVREVYPHVEVVETDTSDNRIQVVFVEPAWTTPAVRLSDGTMRWVFLLALLLDEENRSPVILDEPDLGLHPDALRALASVLKEASERKQIVVATHNVSFIDHFSEMPQSVVVFENEEWKEKAGLHASQYRRLEPSSLPEDMLLGEAWQRGLLGGNRW